MTWHRLHEGRIAWHVAYYGTTCFKSTRDSPLGCHNHFVQILQGEAAVLEPMCVMDMDAKTCMVPYLSCALHHRVVLG